MQPNKMTGLQLLQAVCAGELPGPPMAQTIPMRALRVEEGRIWFSAEANDSHRNPLGGIHGGFAATVLDSVTGCAVHSMLAAGQGYGTIELNVKMIRPVPAQQPLRAEGWVISMTRSLGIACAELKDADERLLAHATATCMLIKS